MNFPIKLPAGFVSKSAKLLALAKNYSPELCVGASILTGIACVVTACVATVKSEPEVREARGKIDEIKGVKEGEERTDLVLTAEQKSEIVKIRVDTGAKIARNYIAPAILGVASIAFNIGGNRILRRNLMASMAAYATLLESYNEYRKRVIEDAGAEKDQEYMHGIRTKEIEVVDEDGNITKKTVNESTGKRAISPYARWFDAGVWDSDRACWKYRNYAWKDDPEKNLRFLISQEKYANMILQRDGMVFLNEVYKLVGMPMTYEGQFVGWTIDGGDGYISFGISEDENQLPCNRSFINGFTPNALLDFNVEGNIADRLNRTFGKGYAEKLIAERM